MSKILSMILPLLFDKIVDLVGYFFRQWLKDNKVKKKVQNAVKDENRSNGAANIPSEL